LLKGSLPGGSPVNQAFEIEENNSNDIGLRLDADGTLWCAKGGSNYNWSGGLKEIPVLAADETIPIANLWNFEQGILLGDGSGADFSIWVDDVGGVPPYRRFYWDDSDTQFRMSEGLQIGGDVYIDGYDVWVDNGGDLQLAGGGGIAMTSGGAPINTDSTTYNKFFVTVGGGTNAAAAVEARLTNTATGTGIKAGMVCSAIDVETGTHGSGMYGGTFEVSINNVVRGGASYGGRFAGGWFRGVSKESESTFENLNAGYFQIDTSAATSGSTITNCYIIDTVLTGGDATMTSFGGIRLTDFTDGVTAPTNLYALHVEAQDGTNKGATKGNIYMAGSGFDEGHVQLSDKHLFSDDTHGGLRAITGAPDDEQDGERLWGGYTVAKTGAYTAADETVILCNATSAAFTITLPAAATNKDRIYVIKKTDASANAVTVDGNAAETIDDAATQTLASQYDSIMIVCDGTEWWII
jgi:hypothetical protein